MAFPLAGMDPDEDLFVEVQAHATNMAAGDRTNMFPDDGMVDADFWSGDAFNLIPSPFAIPLSLNVLEIPNITSAAPKVVYSNWFECPFNTPIFARKSTSGHNDLTLTVELEREDLGETIGLSDVISGSGTVCSGEPGTNAASVCKARLKFSATSSTMTLRSGYFGNIEVRKATYIGSQGNLLKEDRATRVTAADLLATGDRALLDGVTAGLAAKLAKASNLSDLASVSTALDNLGFSANAKALIALTYANMRAALDLEPGVDFLALSNISAVGQTLLAQATQALMRTTGLGLSANGSSLITATDYAAMRALLDLEAGTDFLALSNISAVAQTLLAQTTQALMRTTGLGMSANGSSLVSAADYAAMRTLLGLVIGTNVQAFAANLGYLSGLTAAANKLPYFDGASSMALADLSVFGRSLIDDADASAALTTLGFSTFFKTLIDDASAAAVLTTLGFDTADQRALNARTTATVSTTDATVTSILLFAVPTGQTVAFDGMIVGRRTGGSAGAAGDTALFKLSAVFKNVAGTAALVGSATVTQVAADQPAWAVACSVNGGNARIRVTGATNNNVDWVFDGTVETI